MVSKEQIVQWVADGETDNVDFKAPMPFKESHRAEIAKDIIALCNTKDGGVLLIGVEDEPAVIVGVPDIDARTWEATKIHDYLRRHADPVPVVRVEKVDVDGRRVVVVIVNEFSGQPVVTTRDSAAFVEASVLMRQGVSSKPIASADAMRDLLERAIRRRADQLVITLGKVIRGDDPVPHQSPSYDAELAVIAPLRATTAADRNGQSLGWWQVSAFPQHEVAVTMTQVKRLELWRTASVNFRGGGMPYWDPAQWCVRHSDGQTRLQYQLVAPPRQEAWVAFDSGVFGMVRAMPEDLWGQVGWATNPNTLMDIVETISYLTEMHLFFLRYFQTLAYDGGIRIEVLLGNLAGRSLTSTEGFFMPSLMGARSYSDTFQYAYEVDMAEMPSRVLQLVVGTAVRLFELFNWDNEGLIQQKAIEQISRAGYRL